MNGKERTTEELFERRRRVGLSLSALMMALYFGFMLLVPLAKNWMGSEITPGLSWGILLGALLIVAAWVITVFYIRWANAHDIAVTRSRQNESGQP